MTLEKKQTLLEKTPEELGFDPDALQNKYNAERDKRLKKPGEKHYYQFRGELKALTEDPFTPEKAPREAVNESVEVLIIGGGHCGLLASANLIKQGITDFKIIDTAADFGGTWYWNRYPGIRCDTEAYVYMPLLEETGYIPSEKYATGQEIFEHAKRVGEHYGLYEKTYFQTHVNVAKWQEEESRWQVTTDRGDQFSAKFVIVAMGSMTNPRLPALHGLDKYQGKMFHTARWDYDYTGGSSSDNSPEMDKLHDKRVGVVGTGCTGLQVAPQLAKHAEQLFLFQRTPAAVGVRNNSKTDPAWADNLEPGWQYERIENFGRLTRGEALEQDLVNDGWTEASEIFTYVFNVATADKPLPKEDMERYEKLLDYQKMEALRDRVDEVVNDPDVAEKLKPWYRLFCKRPAFADNYLPIFNQPNVTLVDTEGQGVDALTENGLLVGGVEYPLDCIIFASGYDVPPDYCRRGDITIIGRDGVNLSQHWATGPRALYGYLSDGFPNMLHMAQLIGNPVSANFSTVFIQFAEHIGKLLNYVKQADVNVIEPTVEAVDAWHQAVAETAAEGTDFFAECTPGNFNGQGQITKGTLVTNVYNPGPYEFDKVVCDWIDRGLPGVVLR